MIRSSDGASNSPKGIVLAILIIIIIIIGSEAQRKLSLPLLAES